MGAIADPLAYLGGHSRRGDDSGAGEAMRAAIRPAFPLQTLTLSGERITWD